MKEKSDWDIIGDWLEKKNAELNEKYPDCPVAIELRKAHREPCDINIDVGIDELAEVASLAFHGLMIEGAHHKQWCLEEILRIMGIDLEHARRYFNEYGYDWESGVPS